MPQMWRGGEADSMIVKLGTTSMGRLDTCAQPVKEIMVEAAADPACPHDFGVVCGSRGKEAQNGAYDSGNSKAKWGESDHNVFIGPFPRSEAVDFAPYSPSIRNYLWNTDKYAPVYSALISHFLTVAARLGYTLESGAGYKLKNGGDPGHLSLRFK